MSKESSLSKLAFINGRYFDPITKKLETRNLFLENGRLVGMGVLWDEKDGDFQEIAINDHLIIPNIAVLLRGNGVIDLSEQAFLSQVSSQGIQHLYCMDSRFSESSFLEGIKESFNLSSLNLYPIVPLFSSDSETVLELALLKEEGAVGVFCTTQDINSSQLIEGLYFAELLQLPVLVEHDCDLEKLTAALLQFPKLRFAILRDSSAALFPSIDYVSEPRDSVIVSDIKGFTSGSVIQVFCQQSEEEEMPLASLVYLLSRELHGFFNTQVPLLALTEAVNFSVLSIADENFGEPLYSVLNGELEYAFKD